MFIDFRERGRDWERDKQRDIEVREKHQSGASCMCLDWGLNPRPFGVQDNAPTDGETHPEQKLRHFI